MTKPEKDEVLRTPAQTNPGADPISSSGAGAAQANRSAEGAKASSAGGSKREDAETPVVLTPEVVEDGSEAAASSAETNEIFAKVQAEMEEWKDKYLRLHAEWDTYRRRTAEQRTHEKACATEKLVEHLLPVIDDFERTIDYAEKNSEAGLLEGVHAVHTKLIDALKKEGVEVLDPKGEAFDALECQAIGSAEDKAVPDETVAEVYQKGYKMGKKVLRPAMVTVAVGGPKREGSQEDGQ